MSVSILIPAFRPTFLRQALASALSQGGDDYEIVVSDDSGGEDVRAVVETFRDPRIRYLRTPGRTGAGPNIRNLWEACTTDRMVFLFDDDLLMPYALAELGAALDDHTQAAFAYGRRYKVDAVGRITEDPPAATPTTLIGGNQLARAIVGRVANVVGELTNVMMNRAVGLTADDVLDYFGCELHVVADVSFYLNATRKGPAVAIGRPVSAFRLHGAQNSSPGFNPKFAIGIVEWELFIRGEYDAGRVAAEMALPAIDKLQKAYRLWSKTQPDIGLMAPGLAQLRERIAAGERGVLDATFRASWDNFVETVLSRPRGPQPAAPATT